MADSLAIVIGNLLLLVSLLWQPMTAIKHLRDRAPVIFAVGAAWASSVLSALVPALRAQSTAASRLQYTQEGEVAAISTLTSGFYSAAMMGLMAVLFVAVVYVPVAIFIANLFERRASFSLVVREEYAATASCVLSSLAMALLVTLLP